MRRIAILALAAAGFVPVAACGPVNQSLESVHQPVVTRTDYVFDAAGDGYGHLRFGEDRRVAAWFESIGLGYGDRIAIDGPYGRDAIARIAAGYGLLLADTAPVTTGTVAPGAVRIVVSRSQASVPGCPDWSRPSHPELQASTTSNYGCATNTNLAAMVANPDDLVIGQAASAGGDANTAAKAIKAYREAPSGAAAGLKKESTGGAGGGGMN